MPVTIGTASTDGIRGRRRVSPCPAGASRLSRPTWGRHRDANARADLADSQVGWSIRTPAWQPTKEAPLPGIQIGQLLVEQGVLTEAQVQHILKVQKVSHRPFGDLAER